MEKIKFERSERFEPKEGAIYQNRGGGLYLCHRVYNPGRECEALMQNIKTGWQVLAHGLTIYPDKTIEWDYSTKGVFASLPPVPKDGRGWRL